MEGLDALFLFVGTVLLTGAAFEAKLRDLLQRLRRGRIKPQKTTRHSVVVSDRVCRGLVTVRHVCSRQVIEVSYLARVDRAGVLTWDQGILRNSSFGRWQRVIACEECNEMLPTNLGDYLGRLFEGRLV